MDGWQQDYSRDFWEVYAPIVSWQMICLVLLLSIILNLKNRQVDYTQAFPQAPFEDPVYMHIPQGWHVDDNKILHQHSDPKYHVTTHLFN